MDNKETANKEEANIFNDDKQCNYDDKQCNYDNKQGTESDILKLQIETLNLQNDTLKQKITKQERTNTRESGFRISRSRSRTDRNQGYYDNKYGDFESPGKQKPRKGNQMTYAKTLNDKYKNYMNVVSGRKDSVDLNRNNRFRENSMEMNEYRGGDVFGNSEKNDYVEMIHCQALTLETLLKSLL